MYGGEPTTTTIGDDNVFREHVTVHRSNKLAEDTVIGSHGFFMQHSHVAHNCLIGDHVILAGGALLVGGFGLLRLYMHDQAQRAAVCRALIAGPRVIFADEPTGALDSVAAEIREVGGQALRLEKRLLSAVLGA